MSSPLRALVVVLLVCTTGCPHGGAQQPGNGVSPQAHAQWFPIDSSAVHALEKVTPEGPIACESCHTADSVTQFTCIGCHQHPASPIDGRGLNATLHLDAPDYAARVPASGDVFTQSAGCKSCHKDGRRLLEHFPHGGIEPGAGSFCAMCHTNDRPFDAFADKLKVDPGFKHIQIAADCGGCHQTDTWKGAVGVPVTVYDPAKSITVNALIPRYTDTSISSVAATTQTITMSMNHGAQSLEAGLLANCTACHAEAATGVYFPGLMHSSLATLGLAQPATCNDCHGLSIPSGFVGNLDSARSPQTGEMKHDAVSWVNNVPTTTKMVTQDCNICHQAPNERVDSRWKFAFGKPDAGAEFHRPITVSNGAQPASCIDCHANSRPVGPAGAIQFDHDPGAMGNCATCHTSFATWSGGKFHTAAAGTPSTCLPCHDAARPTSTTNWQSNFTRSPFDYVSNSAGDTHGAGQDCVVCHRSSGTGTWGTNHNWRNGTFHVGMPTTATSCVTCHTTQRPDLLPVPVPPATLGFDHAGSGDCVGCHQETVTRGRYLDLLPIPDGGDWRGGQTYPGATLISAPGNFVRIPSTTLTRAGTRVTGMTTGSLTMSNAMLHTSTDMPVEVRPGPVGSVNQMSCWHCHASSGTTVSTYVDGKFHSALASYRDTPAAAPRALSQPTKCGDCHGTIRPTNIVSKTDAGTWLVPMDHAVTFASGPVSGVSAMECSECHTTPAATTARWNEARFHAALRPGTVLNECLACHYPLTTTASADVTSPSTLPSDFSMKHRSTVVVAQSCAHCHRDALSKSTNPVPAAPLWKPGAYHPTVSAQPTACLDCHTSSEPTTATQGSVVYALTMGGTATNKAQWMHHGDSTVTGKDCATCHQADAKFDGGSAWDSATSFHSRVPAVTTCARCHGTTNGAGAANNNLPVGLATSSTITTSSVSPGVNDQLSHADINVTAFDCSVCHTQKGPSTSTGIQGVEWKQAKFHPNFNAMRTLVMNTTTGRCSTCHLNVKPAGVAGGQDHAAFTATSGSQDCSACHSLPGTGTTNAPNWKGAASFPAFIAVGGFTIPVPPATTAGTTQSGINNLPHPNVATGVQCTTCHPAANPTHRRAAGYDHVSTVGNTNCNACHEAGSDLVAVIWSTATHGDTRVLGPLIIKGVSCSPKHFFPTDCKECHLKPPGNGAWTNATTAQTAWRAPHTNGGNNRSTMTNPATCNKCHASVAAGGCGIPN